MADQVSDSGVDFIHYQAQLDPDFASRSLSGKVLITFTPTRRQLQQLRFSAKYLQIQQVQFEGKKLNYKIEDEQLLIPLPTSLKPEQIYLLELHYRATPKRGMKFYPDHMFSVYHTKYWLPSHSNINDKASFDLSLIHNANLTSVANGQLRSKQKIDQHKVISHWQQPMAIPVYTFGFALGQFQKASTRAGDIQLDYLFRPQAKPAITTKDINQAFSDVPHMLKFFQDKAGFALPQPHYTYVAVAGRMAQEAAGFSLVGEQFIHTLLGDPSENWFVAHELAHEWWGNSITCANFSHFWLNEGLVQFMVAAYKQHRFGEDAYNREIGLAIQRVNKALKNNKVSALAFKHPIAEQEINHTVVYNKGALVFYMLRSQLGDKTFWRALKTYSQNYQGQSVTTQDLKQVFEQVSGQDLAQFFELWVYSEAIPQLFP